jgi:NADH dehydrogenase
MNLVVGATGMLGGEICRLLAEQGAPLRAFIRATSDPAKVDTLRKRGAEIVEGDLKDPSSLAAACAGVETVYSTATSVFSQVEGDSIESVDERGQLNLVEAAEAAGVGRFVFVSFSEMDPDSPLQRAKRAVEKRLEGSSMIATILRPTYFMEVWLSPAVGFDPASGVAQIFGDGDNPISWISRGDVARSVVAAPAEDAVIDLGGPDALSQLEVVEIFEQATGRSFEREHVPAEALEAQAQGASSSLEQSFAALMLATTRVSPTRPAAGELTSVRDFARAQR